MIHFPRLANQRLSRPTVLIVDDTTVVRRFASTVLRQFGYETLMADDGATALNLLRERPADAVLTDLEMPDVSGEELVARLRAGEIPVHRSIPIVIASSKTDSETRDEMRLLGIDAFLAKPIDCRVLESTIKRVLDPTVR